MFFGCFFNAHALHIAVNIKNRATTHISSRSNQGEYLCTSSLLISISNSVVIYRLISPQSVCTASSNETHWFGCDLKSPNSCAMWKRTYGSLSSSPAFLNNLDRTLSVLSPKTQWLHYRSIQLKVPNGASILSVLWKKPPKNPRKDILHIATVHSCFVTLSPLLESLNYI